MCFDSGTLQNISNISKRVKSFIGSLHSLKKDPISSILCLRSIGNRERILHVISAEEHDRELFDKDNSSFSCFTTDVVFLDRNSSLLMRNYKTILESGVISPCLLEFQFQKRRTFSCPQTKSSLWILQIHKTKLSSRLARNSEQSRTFPQ